jgi:DNA-directed RNA polymerase specialized sigma24 family protein
MGDATRWIEALYRETGRQLLTYLSQRVGCAVAEDLLQETFAAALRHPERLRASSSARAYLFGIARNLAATASRRAAREAEPVFWNLAADEESPPDPRLDVMRDGIARLKPELREALEMRLRRNRGSAGRAGWHGALAASPCGESTPAPVAAAAGQFHF